MQGRAHTQHLQSSLARGPSGPSQDGVEPGYCLYSRSSCLFWSNGEKNLRWGTRTGPPVGLSSNSALSLSLSPTMTLTHSRGSRQDQCKDPPSEPHTSQYDNWERGRAVCVLQGDQKSPQEQPRTEDLVVLHCVVVAQHITPSIMEPWRAPCSRAAKKVEHYRVLCSSRSTIRTEPNFSPSLPNTLDTPWIQRDLNIAHCAGCPLWRRWRMPLLTPPTT
ncbi:hypothetical protein B0O80DRAFT_44988 [Mortierella sp. GBAus27b]|nr:hypothetical protein B0O80DRAFT_44988 [Mortierella sp. GBAus27b]